MKLQTISDDKINKLDRGFLIAEMMISFSIMTLLLTSIFTLSSSIKSLKELANRKLENIEYASSILSNISSLFTSSTSTAFSTTLYGNDTKAFYVEPLKKLISDYENAWGREDCNSRFFISDSSFNSENINENIILYEQGIDTTLGTGISNPSTDIEVRNKIGYLVTDSASASLADFFIIDMENPASPYILSTLNTGPGLSSIEVAGPFAFVANMGTTNQLQIIDIRDRETPILLSKLKLPPPQASSTLPFATSIFYSHGLIYLGTEKWKGMEFSIIDVHNPNSPQYLGGFETNTLVKDIYIRNNRAYIATSDEEQIKVLNVSTPENIIKIDSQILSGWETQTSQTFSYFEEEIALGRTTGGINNKNNYEFFLFSSTSPFLISNSKDVVGGVYGILLRRPYVYIATRNPGSEFQIWNLNTDLKDPVYTKSLSFLPNAMTCDKRDLYFSTGNNKGIAVIKLI